MATSYTTRANLPKPAALDRNWHLPLLAGLDQLDAINAVGDLACTPTEQPSTSLNIQISTGGFIKPDGSVGTYAGGTVAVSALSTWNLWVDDAGAIQHAATWPTTPHVRIAIVTTSATACTAFADARIVNREAGPAPIVPLVGSGAGHQAGAAPDPGATAGTLRFLREDATWSAPPGSGTVTSVGISVPADLAVSGSPITGAGTLAITRATQAANQIQAGPTSGAAASPTFRALVTADLPTGVATLAANTFTAAQTIAIAGTGNALTYNQSGTGQFALGVVDVTGGGLYNPFLNAIGGGGICVGGSGGYARIVPSGSSLYYQSSLANVVFSGGLGAALTTATFTSNNSKFTGALTHSSRAATATNYTMSPVDYLIAVTDTTAARTITLLTAVGAQGRDLIIKDESGGAGTNNITITPQAGQTIDGASSASISANYGSVTLYSTGAGWMTRAPAVAASGSGTVTSVGISVPADLAVSGSPITGAGTLAITRATQAANQIQAGPSSGSAASPTFRALVAADLPTTAVTPGSYSLSTITVDAAGRITAASSGSGGGGSGTVTSVDLSVPSFLSVSGNPVTTTGTLAIALANQPINKVMCGPGSGSAAAPTFRSLVAADVPGLDASKITSGQIAQSQGGTGYNANYLDGQLLIGDSNTSGLDKATLTAGAGIGVVNGNGSITIKLQAGKIDSGNGFVLGNGAISTASTTGFTYLPTCAGTPTGTPATQTGMSACLIDSTNSKLWAYVGGAWKGVSLT